jgi:asparagine synthase (glutamine-hydrolysing)
MAGIFAVYKKHQLSNSLEKKLIDCSSKLKHRGPKHTFSYDKFPVHLFYHQKNKLRKNDNLNFAVNQGDDSYILLDGQIFNLDSTYTEKKKLENILIGFKKFGTEFFEQLEGSYSGVIFHENELFGFKDPVGAKPLYYCDTFNFFIFSSELKALTPLKTDVFPVPPGYLVSSSGTRLKYNYFSDFVKDYKLSKSLAKRLIIELNGLIKKVTADNINKNEQICTFLSGGIDSVIITHIAKSIIKNLTVFSVGVNGSKDLIYARKFAKLNNLEHFELMITLDDIRKSIRQVIYALESFDAALIRSAVPMFLLSKFVHENNGFDVVLTGEGGDELFGGYDYLVDLMVKNDSFNKELGKLLKVEHKTGLQRVDRIPYYFSLEARAPLFDQRLVKMSFRIPPEFKIYSNPHGIAKKWILRKAFENEIPEEFIWRKKQKFSDGAGSQFLFKEYISSKISDEEFKEEKNIHNEIILRSKEELYYWRIFEEFFNPTAKTVEKIGLTSNFKI